MTSILSTKKKREVSTCHRLFILIFCSLFDTPPSPFSGTCNSYLLTASINIYLSHHLPKQKFQILTHPSVAFLLSGIRTSAEEQSSNWGIAGHSQEGKYDFRWHPVMASWVHPIPYSRACCVLWHVCF